MLVSTLIPITLLAASVHGAWTWPFHRRDTPHNNNIKIIDEPSEHGHRYEFFVDAENPQSGPLGIHNPANNVDTPDILDQNQDELPVLPSSTPREDDPSHALPTILAGRAADDKPLIGVHIACHDANFTGVCTVYHEPHGSCHNYEFKNWDKWTSIRPSPGQFCYFYEMGDCYGSKVELRWPGTANLRGLRFDNRIKSWNCWRKE